VVESRARAGPAAQRPSVIRQMAMGSTTPELYALILKNPLEDDLRIQFENLLANTAPDSVELELLRRERRIADALDAGESIDGLIRDYKQFRVAQSDYFWDMRGCLDGLFRPFSLWVISCNPDRAFALNIAVKNKLNREVALRYLPVEALRDAHADKAFEIRSGILDFVRRYRGPSGDEPQLADNEIEIAMLATYSKLRPKQNAG
jgi:hypothetical protein